MTFNADAVNTLFAAVVSEAQKLGPFEVVIQHEPKAAPQSLPTLAVWAQSIGPIAAVSGLSATSGRVSFRLRVYLSFLGKPEDAIDPELIALTSLVLNAFSGGFTLGGTVMEVDLLGAYGQSLSADAGYIAHDSKHFRVMEITLPVIIDDLWTQEA
jgi:hypothetical protein